MKTGTMRKWPPWRYLKFAGAASWPRARTSRHTQASASGRPPLDGADLRFL